MQVHQLFGQNNIEFSYVNCDADYKVITVHPEWNLIFFIREERTLIVYDMDRKKVHVIPARVIQYGSVCLDIIRPYYLPYDPLFLESLAEQ